MKATMVDPISNGWVFQSAKLSLDLIVHSNKIHRHVLKVCLDKNQPSEVVEEPQLVCWTRTRMWTCHLFLWRMLINLHAYSHERTTLFVADKQVQAFFPFQNCVFQSESKRLGVGAFIRDQPLFFTAFLQMTEFMIQLKCNVQCNSL